MTFHVFELADFPKLAAWYEEKKHQPPSVTACIERLIFSIARALCQDNPERLKTWMRSQTEFFEHSTNAQQDFQTVEDILGSMDLDYMSLSCEISELAVRLNMGISYFNLVTTVADKTGLAVFRFLAAWTAINNDDLETCINECDKIDQPFACVHFVQGQAFLESGRVTEAIDSLEIANELEPNDVYTLFQLARAYHVANYHDKAWTVLNQCGQLTPNHPEVATLKAFVALANKDCEDWLNDSWQSMCAALNHVHNGTEFGIFADLVFQQKEKSWFHWLLGASQWEQIKKDQQFYKSLPTVLRSLDRLGWQQETVTLLNAVA